MTKYRKEYTWHYIAAACSSLAHRVKETERDHPITHVVGISRGGLIPATLIAKHLDVREVVSFGLKSYNDGDDYETRISTPTVYQDIRDCYQLSRDGSHTLVVDDVTDKGNTFKYIERALKDMSSVINFKTSTIFKKPTSSFDPDYVYNMAPIEEWIVFPWEN